MKGFGLMEMNQIHDYFIQFPKKINDMKITKLEIPVHQRNTKFVDNSGQIGSGLVTTPTTPSVPSIKKQLSKLFQPLFDDDEEFSPDVHPHLVNVDPPSASEIAHDSPSMKTVTEDAPTATTITSPS
uniref:Uncharacterized protein n=1 Tax=Tanacetum cinerariifolium TaxID=118510 RepID=A0A6L2K6T6_TANCI|nr:hypothetical protein [Tanacetum cinerariifolium]